MTQQDKPADNQVIRKWEPPTYEDITKALTHFRGKRPDTVYRTIKLKLHKPSWRKAQTLLWAQAHATNMTARILETLREEPGEVRPDLALACIIELLDIEAKGKQSDRVRKLAEIISARFRDKHTGKHKMKRETPVLAILSAEEYPIAWTLRGGVFHACASMILNWYLRIRAGEPEQKAGKETENSKSDSSNTPPAIPDLYSLHAVWASRRKTYEAAEATLIPFGRHKGKPFSKVGKREIRWLDARLVSDPVIKTTLEHIEVLLNREHYHGDAAKAARLLQAEQAFHPWRTSSRLQRRPRAGRIVRYTLDSREPRVRLEILNEEELLVLQDELLELQLYAQDFDRIREAVKIFLQGGHSYPTVRPILSEQDLEAAFQEHDDALDRFYDPFPRDATDVTLVSEDQLLHVEELARVRLYQVAQAVQEPKLQPLAYQRTIRPNEMSAWALLYRKYTPTDQELRVKFKHLSAVQQQQAIERIRKRGEVYQYFLAAVVQDTEKTFKGQPYQAHIKAVQHRGDSDTRPTKHIRDFFVPERGKDRKTGEKRPNLYYVNFPETIFTPPERTSLLLFPLECGWEYHEDTILRALIEREREAQHQRYNTHCGEFEINRRAHQLLGVRRHRRHFARPSQRVGKAKKRRVRLAHERLLRRSRDKSLAQCLPKQAILGTAKIVSNRTAEGLYEFSLLVPTPAQIPPVTTNPTKVLGIHENRGEFSYAVLDLQGRLLELGDLTIPWYVLPKEGARSYSENYAYEVARAIVNLANKHDAYIGFEDTSYQKKPGLSRNRNRRVFARPLKKIATVLKDKALQAGLLVPRETHGISPKLCSRCIVDREVKNQVDENAEEQDSEDVDITEEGQEAEERGEQHTIQTRRSHQVTSVCPACGSQHLSSYLQIPMLLQATAVIANIPGVESLQLSASTLLAILTGDVTQWSDSRIVADNPNQRLPDMPIVTVNTRETDAAHRMILAYLREARELGDDRDPEDFQFEADYVCSHRANVATVAMQQAGSIGYIAWQDIELGDATVVALSNAAEAYVLPTSETMNAAAMGFTSTVSDLAAQDAIRLPVANTAYPLTDIVWALLPRHWNDTNRAKALVDFLLWVLTEDAHWTSSVLNGISLPENIRAQAIEAVRCVQAYRRPVMSLRRRTQIGDATSRARASAFRPRNITIDIAGACMPSLYEAISSLTEYYQNVCSTVRIECMSMDEQSALQAVVDGSHEFGITNKHASDEELVSTVAGLSLVDCETCGRTWRAKEVWFTCDRCHHHTLARYNTAVLVAQYTLEQLINHYQHSKEKGEQAK